MSLNILVVVPSPDFVTQLGGVGGHMAHLIGVIEGYLLLGHQVTLIAHGSNKIVFSRDINRVELPEAKGIYERQIWNRDLVKKVSSCVKTGNFSFCYIRYARQFTIWLPLIKRSLKSCPMVVEVNSFAAQDKGYYALLDFIALSKADIVLCVSEILKEQIFIRLGERIAKKIIVIPNGVNLKRFDTITSERKLQNKVLQIGYVGTLKHKYGIEEIFNALKILRSKNVKFVLNIAGTGPARASLENLVDNKEEVQFHGAIPFEHVPSFLKSLDVLIYTTTLENTYQSPIKIYEYMAAGRPIVSMRTPITESLIVDGVSGHLVPIGSEDALAEAIYKIYSLPDGGKGMGKAARLAVEKHSWDVRMAMMLKFIKMRGFSV